MLRNRRALAGHLRHNSDDDHAELKRRWQAWRDTYRSTKRCRKCGGTWEITDKALKDKKRCPQCETKRKALGKRAYERLPTRPGQVQRRVSRVTWSSGDRLYSQVVAGLRDGERVNTLRDRLGVTYKVIRAIGEDALGADGYRSLTISRKRAVGEANLAQAHEQYRALTPKQKARLLKKRFGGTCQLERTFAAQLHGRGLTATKMNDWQSVPVEGQRVPREADIKLSLGDGRKVVILCDGEAFHGPGTIFGDPEDRVALDRQTALAFFGLGYSVARYSESEIHDGSALDHLCGMVKRLRECERVYRNWCPDEEVAV